MPASKGKPTDLKLPEQVKKVMQNETNKDGCGNGQWSAWKSAKLSKEYEKRGRDYENEPGSKHEPKQGTPEEKSGKKRQREMNKKDKEDQCDKAESAEGEGDAEEEQSEGKENKTQKKGGKQATVKKSDPQRDNTAKKAGRPKKGKGTAKKAAKVPREGMRKSARIQQADGQERGRAKKQKTGYV